MHHLLLYRKLVAASLLFFSTLSFANNALDDFKESLKAKSLEPCLIKNFALDDKTAFSYKGEGHCEVYYLTINNLIVHSVLDENNGRVKLHELLVEGSTYYSYRYEYAANGYLISAEDKDGFTVYVEYDEQGKRSRISDSEGNSLKYTYYPSGKVKTISKDDIIMSQTYTDTGGIEHVYCNSDELSDANLVVSLNFEYSQILNPSY